MKRELKGINTVIATAFTDKGDIDLQSMTNLINHLIKINCDGITLFGIASEFHKLTDNEKDILAKLLIEKTNNTNTYSVLSITDHSKEIAVKRARVYEKLGANCLMVLPPFFLNPSIEQIKDHIFSILKSVNIPVLIQYAPGETKKIIPVEEMAIIKRKYSNAIFKLEPNPPMNYVRKMLELEKDTKIFIGYAGLYMLDVLQAGGKGTMPGCSFAEIYIQIDKLFNKGLLEQAKQLHEKLMHYVRVWMTNPEYIISIEKFILKQRGIISSDYCRAPYYQLSTQDKNNCDKFINEFSSLLN